jgi:hypothetical protein
MVKKMIADPRLAEMFESKKYCNNAGFKKLMGAVTGYYNEPYFKELVERITHDFEKEISLSEFGILSLLQDQAYEGFEKLINRNAYILLLPYYSVYENPHRFCHSRRIFSG